jgi:YibE/F-like protein
VVDGLAATAIVLAVATVIGLVALWPHGKIGRPGQFGPVRTLGGRHEEREDTFMPPLRLAPVPHRDLFHGALEVGHDHIAATVATLVFAYAGAALPVLLIFNVGGTSFVDALNGEAVADAVIAALVGSIGLIASMPITTALAAVLAPRMSDKQLASAEHTHAHAHAH